MFHTGRRTTRSRPLLVMLAMVAATFGAGFALGRYPEMGNVARLSAPPASPAARGNVTLAVHDDSLPDTADTLSHERLRDEDQTPTF